MDIRDGFPGSVGDTPLIRIPSLSEATGCDILAKAEHLNPGGSVKDRAAKAIVEQAERDGQLRPGGAIVEGTAGNTGIGLALMALARGYRCVIVMPSNQSQEKIDLLRSLRAEVELVAPAPFKDPNNYYHVARRRAEEIEGAFWANQFENTANADTHYATTGPEIWRQTDGRIDGFICAAGTGGTLGGVTSYLKERSADIATYLVDPMGSGLFSYVHTGEIQSQGSSITEGIGIMRITANFARAQLDGAFQGTDREVVEMVHYVLERDAMFVGSSSGLNLVGAVRLARELGRGKTIVTLICDGGGRYQSRLFNPRWLEDNGLTPRATGLEFLD